MAIDKLKKGFFSGTSKIFDGTLEKIINKLIDAVNSGSGGEAADVTSETITDATSVGKALIVATDQAAARAAIGAGTSNLAVGTAATDAKAGNYTPSSAEVGSALKAKAQIAALTAVTTADATDEATAVALANANKTAINAIIAALKA